ncbi:MAG: hypothetical protein CMJ18_08145 [Phycisphaeraceae bacterium]|nr:hypothetical protein [Phycisphaeraceae bacterium]
MNESITDEQLAAFADGELTGAASRPVVQRLAQDPAAARKVLQFQEMRQAVARTMQRDVPPAPESLRQSVAALAESETAGSVPGTEARAPELRIGRWAPAAAAAVLFVASLIMFLQGRDTAPGHPVGAGVLPVAMTELFEERHFGCTRGPDELMGTEMFSDDLEVLPSDVAKYLGSRPTPSLDLSGIGYEFHAAGRCNVPGEPSVHLIYRSDHDALSLWLRPYEGMPNIEAGRIFTVLRDGSRLLIWRDAAMVYFLVGDSIGITDGATTTRIEAAARMLAGL